MDKQVTKTLTRRAAVGLAVAYTARYFGMLPVAAAALAGVAVWASK